MDCWILYTRKRKLKPLNNIQLPLAAPVGPGDGGGADLVGGVAAGSQHAVPGEEDDVAAAVRGNGLAAPLAVVRPLQLIMGTFSTNLPQYSGMKVGHKLFVVKISECQCQHSPIYTAVKKMQGYFWVTARNIDSNQNS